MEADKLGAADCAAAGCAAAAVVVEVVGLSPEKFTVNFGQL
jgi:hypothetical protein